MEWYDFALFGYFSDIIAQVFFPPSEDENENLIKTFAIFGGAFIMRPIGGLVIGYIGDKHGRKTALTRSLFMMAIPTTLMGCLPSYASAGWLSPACLCICRLIQGVSVGGQLPASLVYTVEKRDPSTWVSQAICVAWNVFYTVIGLTNSLLVFLFLFYKHHNICM